MNLELIIPIAAGVLLVGAWVWVAYKGAESPGATQLPPKPTCMICVQNDGDVQSEYFSDYAFGSRTYNYHLGCVVDAVCNPRKYEDYRVSYALQIVEAIATKKKAEEERKIREIQVALQRRSDCKKACKRIRDENLLSG
jgi:hypothetical protein